MADDPKKPTDAKDKAPEGDAAPAKKKPPVAIIGAVAGIMVVEAAGVYFLVSKFNQSPQAAMAKEIHGDEPAEHAAEGEHGGEKKAEGGDHGGGDKGGAAEAPKDPEQSIELPLVSDKFQNMTAGVAWIWDAEIFIQIKAKNEKMIADTLKSREAEVKEGIAMIFRKATLNQLKEPGLETLNRQVSAFVAKIIEPDADGNSRVLRVLIPKCRGFATD